MTTSIIYPTDYGVAQAQAKTTWALARDGPANNVFSSPTFMGAGASTAGASSWTCYQNFLRFDTSVLGGATGALAPIRALLSITPTTNSSQTVGLRVRVDAWGGGTVTIGDYLPRSSLAGAGALVAHLTQSSWPPDGPIYFTDDAMIANLNLSGFTDLIIYTVAQEDDVAPVTASEIQIYGSGAQSFDQGLTSRPRLIVTWGVPNGDPLNYSRFPKPRLRRA